MNYIGWNRWDGDEKFYKFVHTVKSGTYEKIIIFGQNEWEWHNMPQPQFAEFIDYCNEINNPLNIITASDHLHYPVIKPVIMHWWNTYWLMKTYNALRANAHGRKVSIDLDKSVDYQHYYISMNNRPHNHRLYLIDLLSKNELLEHGAVSLHMNSNNYRWKYFEYKRMVLEPEFVDDRNQYRVPSQYYSSFAQLISESSGTVIMMSEKTSIPILIGKPFLVASHQHFHQFLKRLGFELYDEIFDYAFDNEPDDGLRYDMLLQNFKKLSQIPKVELFELQQMIKNKIEHNKQRAHSIIMDMNTYPNIAKDVINWYKKTGKIIDKHLINDWETLQQLRSIEI